MFVKAGQASSLRSRAQLVVACRPQVPLETSRPDGPASVFWLHAHVMAAR